MSQTDVDDAASQPSSRGRRSTDHEVELPAGTAAAPVLPDAQLPARWQRSYVNLLFVLDALGISIAMAVAYVVRFGASSGEPVGDRPAFLMATLITVAWLLMLSFADCYQARTFGFGSDEFKAIVVGTLRLFGTIAVVSYILKLEIARGFVAIAMPIGLVLLLLGRWLARRWLQRQRRQGRFQHRVVVVGDRVRVAALVEQLRSEPHAGYAVVGACLPVGSAAMRADDVVPVLGDLATVPAAVRASSADTVAISASPDVHSSDVRRIAWSLEGSGVDLIVAPAVTDVAGPRITIRPVAGLPLLHVEEPEFTGGRRLLKSTMDRVGAVLGLLLVAPILIPAALAVRLTSPGPAVFRQVRIGRDGEEFRCLKLRTMYVDAEDRLAEVLQDNHGDGLLVKITDDPRITPVGRFLRRTSIDELPQLWNVLRGDMALVGPRPLAVKDEEFEGDTRRRMLVRPGITGLWQVSGREDQSWEDAVRLDLYYVENWSIALDFLILARTVLHVLRGSGT